MHTAHAVEQPTSPPDLIEVTSRDIDERADEIRDGQSDYEWLETLFDALDISLAFRRDPTTRTDMDRLRLSRVQSLRLAMTSVLPSSDGVVAAIIRESLTGRYIGLAEKSFDRDYL